MLFSRYWLLATKRDYYNACTLQSRIKEGGNSLGLERSLKLNSQALQYRGVGKMPWKCIFSIKASRGEDVYGGLESMWYEKQHSLCWKISNYFFRQAN